MSYCIDTSALMDGWVRYYPQETFPTLWVNLDRLIEANRLISSEEVLQELERKEGDTLYGWAKDRDRMFLPLDASIQACAKQIMLDHPQLVDGRTGKSFADPWVIATAHVNKVAVVTGEKPSGRPNRPKIPDVCRQMNVVCISFVDLIRREKWRF